MDDRPPTAPRWLSNKLCGLDEAMGVVRDGDMLALGGMALHRRPVAACAALIRLGRGGLTLLDYVGSFAGDILIGAGTVSTVRSCFFGLDVLGLAPMHRRAVADGEIRVIEDTEATIAYGLRAALAQVDFLPARIWSQTDLPAIRDDLREVASPYSGERYIALPAIVPDVTIVHAWAADAAGNAVLRGNDGLDAELAAASRITIVTAERIVETSELERHGADILGGCVDHVVAAPCGAWPSSCHPDYAIDFPALADYVESCRDGAFDSFLRDRVL